MMTTKAKKMGMRTFRRSTTWTVRSPTHRPLFHFYIRIYPIGDGEAHLLELSKLAEKDPEFYKYLQENDQELLEFNPDRLAAGGDDDIDMDDEEEGGIDVEKAPVLTLEIVKKWSKALLEVRPTGFIPFCMV